MLLLTTHKEHPERTSVGMNTMESILLDESTSEYKQIYVINEEDVIYYEYSQVDTILITILVPILLCLGVINNSAFLFVMFRVPTMRSATNICLAHLAVADLLYLTVTSIVFIILSYAASPSVANNVILNSSAKCFTFGSLRSTGYFVSIALLTTVSLERYLAVCHPVKHLKIRGRRRTNIMVAICWVVGLMFACSQTLGISADNYKLFVQWPEGYQDYPTEVSFCYGHFIIWRITVPLGIVPWFIAMIANVFMYAKIIYALNKRKSATLMKRTNNKAQKSLNKVAQVLIANGVVFFICQTPFVVFVVTRYVYTVTPGNAGAGWYTLLRNGPWFSEIPLLINTIVNPLIYGTIHAQYRSAFIQAFRCNTGSSQLQFDKNIPAVSAHVMKRARNLNETECDVTSL